LGVLGATVLLFVLHLHMRASGPPPSPIFSDDPLTRLLTLATLNVRGNETYRRVVEMAFEDGVEVVRAEAAEQLGYLWGEEASGVLSQLLRHGSALVRAGVVEGLRARGGPPPKWLKEALNNENSTLVRQLFSEWEKRFAAP